MAYDRFDVKFHSMSYLMQWTNGKSWRVLLRGYNDRQSMIGKSQVDDEGRRRGLWQRDR